VKIWRFKYLKEDLKIIKPKEFEKLIEEAPYVFIIFMSDINVIRPECFISTANATLALKLPAEFEEYEDVFDMKQADILTEYNHFEYTIKIKRRNPPFRPLYNLLE
jgi:hypothetical protein